MKLKYFLEKHADSNIVDTSDNNKATKASLIRDRYKDLLDIEAKIEDKHICVKMGGIWRKLVWKII